VFLSSSSCSYLDGFGYQYHQELREREAREKFGSAAIGIKLYVEQRPIHKYDDPKEIEIKTKAKALLYITRRDHHTIINS
jgi:hypothetical protein